MLGRIVLYSSFWLAAVFAAEFAWSLATGLVESRNYVGPAGIPVHETTVHPSPWWLRPATLAVAAAGVAVITLCVKWSESRTKVG